MTTVHAGGPGLEFVRERRGASGDILGGLELRQVSTDVVGEADIEGCVSLLEGVRETLR